MPALVTLLYPGMFAVGEATPTPVPVSNPYGELGSKRGRPKGSTNKATARKPGPNARVLASKKAASASRMITSMFERSPAEAGTSSSSALPPNANGPVPRLRVAHKAAAAAAAIEQEIVRVVRAAAVDPRGRTAHHNQARLLELDSKRTLTSLIIFKPLHCKKS